MMNKRMHLATVLLVVATAGLRAESKHEFSATIHPIRDTFAPTDSVITIELTTTNLTGHKLDFMEYGKPYTYYVR